MLITFFIILVILLALAVWLTYRNLRHSYFKVAKPLPLKDQLQLQHQARQQVTTHAPKLRVLFGGVQVAWVIGLILILISSYNLETKLALLIFPTNTAITSVMLLLIGTGLLTVPAFMWPSQSYAYWTHHLSEHVLVTPTEFKHYRRRSIGSIVALGLFIIIAWSMRAVSISTAPILILEYLAIGLVLAIPVIALIVLIAQCPYLIRMRYLKPKSAHTVKFGTLNAHANAAVYQQQPHLKRQFMSVLIAQLVAYVCALIAFWLIYANIIAPSFAVDSSAVFPAAIFALFTLVILETVGALWPTKRYHYLQQLDTTQLPFTVSDAAQFNQYRYHGYYFHLSAGIVWVTLWLATVGAYYYFG